MKRTWKQGIAAATVAGLLLSFAACQKKVNDGKTTTTLATNTVSETAQTSTEPTTQTQALREPLSSAAHQDATMKRTVQTTGKQGSGSAKDTLKPPAPADIVKTPKNTAEALALYKSAVAGLKTSCKFSRKLDSATVMGMDLKEMRFAEAFNRTNQPLTGVKLPSLSLNEVSSASISAAEKEITIRFNLKDYTGDYKTIHGAGGYAYIDISEMDEFLNSALGGASGSGMGMSISKGQSDVTMSGGIWTVVISKSTGKIVKASFSYRENMRLQVTGNVSGNYPVSGYLKLSSHGTGTFQTLS